MAEKKLGMDEIKVTTGYGGLLTGRLLLIPAREDWTDLLTETPYTDTPRHVHVEPNETQVEPGKPITGNARKALVLRDGIHTVQGSMHRAARAVGDYLHDGARQAVVWWDRTQETWTLTVWDGSWVDHHYVLHGESLDGGPEGAAVGLARLIEDHDMDVEVVWPDEDCSLYVTGGAN